VIKSLSAPPSVLQSSDAQRQFDHPLHAGGSLSSVTDLAIETKQWGAGSVVGVLSILQLQLPSPAAGEGVLVSGGA
jgi:hypothetical protein